MRRRLPTLALFAVAALLLVAGLGRYGLWDPDEGRHSEIARELYSAATWQGWVVPMRNFAPYHDKPILYYWLVALAYGVAGPTELGARLVPALSAFAVLATVFAWTARAWDRTTAAATVAVLVTSLGFLGLGRYGSLDMLLTACLALGLSAASRFTESPGRTGALLVAAAAAGLGMLTKGLVAPLFIGAIPLAHALLARRPLPRDFRAYLAAAAVFVAVAAPWYVAAGVVDPGYLRDFFLVHHLRRFTEDGTTFHAGPWWYYGPAILLMFFPWSFLLPATLADAGASARRDPTALFFLCWAALVVGFFSLSHGKLATYILPALPPLAALTARMLVRAAEASVSTRTRRLASGGLVALAVVFVVVPAIVRSRLPARYGDVVAQAGALPLLIPATGLAVAALWYRRGVVAAAVGLGAGAAGCALGFYLGVAPAVSAIAGERVLAGVVAAHEPAPIVAYDVRASSLLFYVPRPVLLLDRPAALRSVLDEHPFVWVLTSPRHVDEIERAAPVYPWAPRGHHVLYGCAPPPGGGAPPGLQ